jgi:hypothetical protein
MEHVNPLTRFRIDGRRPNEVGENLILFSLSPVSPRPVVHALICVWFFFFADTEA